MLIDIVRSSFTCHQGLVNCTDVKYLTAFLEKKNVFQRVFCTALLLPLYLNTVYVLYEKAGLLGNFTRTLRVKVDSDREPKQKQIKKKEG
jgi:hypothetical protein